VGPLREAPAPARGDVRGRGFPERASLEAAIAWLDAQPADLGGEAVPLDQAAGRVLAAPPIAPIGLPALDRCLVDGHAVRAAEVLGASAYDPARLRLVAPGQPVPSGAASPVALGEPLPAGADAVLPFEQAEAGGDVLEVAAGVAEGAGVERAAGQVAAGMALPGLTGPLRPQDLALLRALGIGMVDVLRRPRIRILIAGPRAAAAGPAGGVAPPDLDGPLLRHLVERDGGLLLPAPAPGPSGFAEALIQALQVAGDDLLLVAGRTGTGLDDDAPVLLAAEGRLALHGISLRPGGSTALGLAAGRPVVLLPGEPLACLLAYELLAGRLVRRLGGRDPGLPHPTREAVAGRKLVSAVGVADVSLVRLVAGQVEPVAAPGEGGLAAAARADGFVLVPAALEGFAPGAQVTVQLQEG
jgi:molybdopterin molybdotransferase